jgi:alkylresorcinol/alkylpyrone synthase
MTMVNIVATANSFPSNYYTQDELIQTLRKFWSNGRTNLGRLERIHRNTTIQGRHLALPIEAYDNLYGFGDSNKAWTETALKLGEETLLSLLDKSDISAADISLIVFTTITGISVPSIDARLMNRLPFRPGTKRMPLFGLGCLGGAAGLARAADYLTGHPEQAAILLSIELCSLTLQRDDLSIENIIASGLFGDGAAAVLLTGRDHPANKPGQPRIIDTCSVFFPHSEHIMGWDVQDTGLKVILSADVAEVAEKDLRPALESFLGVHHLGIQNISHWITHPGGPKVIQAIEEGLSLPSEALQLSRKSLSEVGNISSTSVLLILAETLARRNPKSGEFGVLMAMGPGFCAELLLLKW